MTEPKFYVGQKVRIISTPVWRTGRDEIIGAVATIRSVDHRGGDVWAYQIEEEVIGGVSGMRYGKWNDTRFQPLVDTPTVDMPGPRGVLP